VAGSRKKSEQILSAEEKAAMRALVKERKSQQDGETAVREALAKMAPADRALGKKVHALIKKTAPELTPKTWYGMPAYANADGKVVVFFQDSGKFKYRYSTLGFQDAANLDEGDIWPIAYALQKWSPAVEKKIVQLLKASLS
jgi:uncharacterized protein YdhG (YjbR/CyaY superfamily)